jgi:hypothetical protein
VTSSWPVYCATVDTEFFNKQTVRNGPRRKLQVEVLHVVDCGDNSGVSTDLQCYWNHLDLEESSPDWGKPRKTSVRIANVLAEILNRDLREYECKQLPLYHPAWDWIVFNFRFLFKQFPCTGSNVYISIYKKLQVLFDACVLRVSCLSYFSTLKMEAVSSFKMSVNFYRTTGRYGPEYSTRQSVTFPLHTQASEHCSGPGYQLTDMFLSIHVISRRVQHTASTKIHYNFCVNLFLCLIKHQSMETLWRTGGVTPRIINHATR